MMWAFMLWAASNPVVHYFQQLSKKDPFRGLYQVNVFDVALLMPYFVVLVVLAAYGAHRYELVWLYFKHRKNRAPFPAPARLPELPKVTIQLPIYNEKYVAERLIESVAHIDYPREKLEIQVLDDSTDETVEIARACVERYAAMGLPIHYLHRPDRTGFKAGALAEGARQATGEFFAIFDADFIPPSDFLERTIHYFADPKVAVVQTRWTYLNSDYSVLTEIERILLDGHFVIEHGARHRAGCFFNFNGTAGVWRRCAIEEAGGWQHDTLTEDTDLSYRAQMLGWKFVYVPEIECPSELPVEMNAFKMQQARWAKGLMQTARKILPRLLVSDQPWRVKFEAVFHLTANISYPMMIVLSTLLLPAMIVRFYQGWFQMLYIDLPLFLASTLSISSFYLAAQRELRPRDWLRTISYLPFLMAIGIGLCVNNAKAVLEAIFGKSSGFVRTPKYRIERAGERWADKKYSRRSGWMPLAEVSIGLYFVATVIYAVQNENYATVPFLLLFVWGYLYTGAMSLAQVYLERLAARRAARLEAEAAAASA